MVVATVCTLEEFNLTLGDDASKLPLGALALASFSNGLLLPPCIATLPGGGLPGGVGGGLLVALKPPNVLTLRLPFPLPFAGGVLGVLIEKLLEIKMY